MSGGWNPTVHLTCASRRPAGLGRRARRLRARRVAARHDVAGAAPGSSDAGACLARRRASGRRSGRRLRASRRRRNACRRRRSDETGAVTPLWRVARREGQGLRRFPERRDRRRYRRSPQREGFRSVEHLKRYTTLGMATDQGKTSNVNGLAIMAALDRALDPADRHHDLPPALYAGRDRRARRPSSRQGLPADAADAGHDWAQEQGAIFVEAGQWLRAQYFPRPGESDWLETVDREVERRAQRASASATSRPSARSTSRAPMRRRSSTASTSTRSRRCRSARRATA